MVSSGCRYSSARENFIIADFKKSYYGLNSTV